MSERKRAQLVARSNLDAYEVKRSFLQHLQPHLHQWLRDPAASTPETKLIVQTLQYDFARHLAKATASRLGHLDGRLARRE